MKDVLKLSLMGMLVGCYSLMSAQDFVYSPTNPAFGGNPVNYSWMLNSANAQKSPDLQQTGEQTRTERLRDEENILQGFEQRLNNLILNRLSQQIVEQQFGGEAGSGLNPGTYNVGTYQINVTETNQGVDVVLFDASTGNETTITIPYY